MTQEGAGEILLTSVDRDGTMQGYDKALISLVVEAVPIPVVACGGAANLQDCRTAIVEANAAAVAVGALFVYKGPHRAVLINYPAANQLRDIFQ